MIRYFREMTSWYLLRIFASRRIRNSDTEDTTIFWELGGFTEIAKKDAVLARSLEINGRKTLTIICDGAPRACMRRGIENQEAVTEWSKSCTGCTHEMETILKRTGSTYLTTSQLISRDELDYFEKFAKEIELGSAFTYRFLGVTVGEYAFSSTVRFMKGLLSERGNILGMSEEIFRIYFYAALVNTSIAQKVIKLNNVVQGVTSHGGYTDYGPFVQMFVKNKVDVVFWESGYQKNAHYFSRPNSIKKVQIRGVDKNRWNEVQAESSESINLELLAYFKKRYLSGTGNDVVLNSASLINLNSEQRIRKTIYLFCHVSWDAVFDTSNMLFETPHRWLSETIEFALLDIHYDWVIRVHPSEAEDTSQLKTSEYISVNFPNLPNHIKVMTEHDRTNIITLLPEIDLAITIYGTIGLELASLGKRVMCAGEAHYAEKGFTWDPKTKSEYFNFISSLKTAPMVPQFQVELAQKYAYLTFVAAPFYVWQDSAPRGHWSSPTLFEVFKIALGLDNENLRLRRWLLESNPNLGS